MDTSITIEPTPWQRRVLAIPEQHSLALLGGRGGGKSFCVALLVLRHVNQYRDRAKVLITRRRLKSLGQFQIELSRLLTLAFGPGNVSFNQQDSIYKFRGHSGSIQLAHCESAAALSDIATGMNFSLLCLDEVGDAPTLPLVDELMLSLRQPGVPLRCILSGNPGGVNHGPLSERYVTNREPFVPFQFASRTWVLCPSILEDNPHLPDEYRDNFEAMRLTDEGRYQAMRYGRWDMITGDFLSGVFQHSRVVFDHHELPPDVFSWLKIGADWGTASPAYFGLGGITRMDWRLNDDRFIPRGSFVLFDEHAEYSPLNLARGSGRTPHEIAPAIQAMCHRNGVKPKGVIDCAAFAKSLGNREVTVGSLFKQAGVSLSPAKKGPRVQRHDYLRQLLANGEFFVASRCRYFLATVPTLPRDPRNMEDCAPDAVDHALDAVEYLIAGPQSGRVAVGGFEAPRRLPDTGNRIMYV